MCGNWRQWHRMTGGGKSILVVDDEAAVTLALETFFQNKGYEVLRALYGDQAIGQIEQKRPSLIILDLQMKNVDGIAVLEKVRSSFPGVKVLVITAYMERYQKDLEKLKPEMVKQKPLSLEELTQAVEILLDQRKPEAPSQAASPSEGIRLLFVEGDERLCEGLLKPYFEDPQRSFRYEMAFAGEPEAAVHLAAKFKPHLVLLDGTRLPMGVDPGKLAARLSESSPAALEVILYSIPSQRSKGEPVSTEQLEQLEAAIRRAVENRRKGG